MERVDVDANVEYFDKVKQWRIREMHRLFPDMPMDDVERLALGDDPCLLESAKRLHDDGCPHELAYRILV